MVVEQIEDVLLPIHDGVLTAVEVVQGAPLRPEQQAHRQRKHEHVQLFVLVDGPRASLFEVEQLLREQLVWLHLEGRLFFEDWE